MLLTVEVIFQISFFKLKITDKDLYFHFHNLKTNDTLILIFY